MADNREKDGEPRSARPVLLLGAGRRAHEVGLVLATLSGLDGEGARRREPLAARGRAEGWLILEAGRVPGEDIGFVRRFLERHPGWRLLVVADDLSDPRAKGLLALTRAQFLPWPPDLEQLRALASAEKDSQPAARPSTPPPAPPPPEPPREERAPVRRAPRRAGAVGGSVDVSVLVEELLAGAALQSRGNPRYHFQSGEAVLLARERGLLAEGLGGLVDLARVCAGEDGLVRAAIAPAGELVRIGLDFPLAGLPEKDLPALLERPFASEEDPSLALGVASARQGVALLREAGGRVELASTEPGRVHCEVRLPIQPPAAVRAGRVPGKPEDPFA
ncbi:MAG: hypothetical protein ABL998_15865 [Planctomycetota bacterium]